MEVELDWRWDGGAFCSSNVSFKDSVSLYPSSLHKYVDKTYFHPKTGYLYQVVGMTFDATNDRWCLAYQRVSKGGLRTGPLFTRTLDNFLDEGRFLEVKK